MDFENLRPTVVPLKDASKVTVPRSMPSSMDDGKHMGFPGVPQAAYAQVTESSNQAQCVCLRQGHRTEVGSC